MKLTVYFAILLISIVALTAAVGYSPTQAKWGDDGIASMKAVAVICLASALVSILPLAIVAPRHPDQIGLAAFAAMVIRLLLTMGLIVGFQILQQPHTASLLFWAPVFYLLLLAIETTFGVIMVKRYYRVTPKANDGATS